MQTKEEPGSRAVEDRRGQGIGATSLGMRPWLPLCVGLPRPPPQTGGQMRPAPGVSPPRCHQHLQPYLGMCSIPFGGGLGAPSGALWAPRKKGNGHGGPHPAGVVCCFNPSLCRGQSVAAASPSVPRHAGVGESGARHVPTQEESLICISFSSHYRAAGGEGVLTAAVSKVQGAAITSDRLKAPMTVLE